ncbi:uncharacterized protein LOC103986755 isoform X2 [Musa acuminata AAA Group]|uniref:uncharacterized protein LOC103986755 isoform X2 n=1 Tax=Musa acuminata AAA Group TaxID=214697 RepID=UPI0031E01FD7
MTLQLLFLNFYRKFYVVKYVETEKDLLKKKEKELKETINSLLQSREAFLSHYEDSTYQLKQSIQKRDRKLVLLTEKIHTQIQLFDSMEKEAAAIKQVVNTVEDTVNGKEQEVARLKRKVDQISTLEKDFVEKILHLEKKLSSYQLELRRRDATINELEEKLEAAKFTNNFQPQIEELQKTLLVKDEVIQRLTIEKQTLYLHLGNMEVMSRKIQDTLFNVNTEDHKLLSSFLGSQEMSDMISTAKNESLENIIQENKQRLPSSTCRYHPGFSPFKECLLQNNSSEKHVAGSSSHQPCGSPPGAASSEIPAVDDVDKSNGLEASLIRHLGTENLVTDAQR